MVGIVWPGEHNRANSGGSAKQQSGRGFIIYARLPPSTPSASLPCLAWPTPACLPLCAPVCQLCTQLYLSLIRPICLNSPWKWTNVEHHFLLPPDLFVLSSAKISSFCLQSMLWISCGYPSSEQDHLYNMARSASISKQQQNICSSSLELDCRQGRSQKRQWRSRADLAEPLPARSDTWSLSSCWCQC